MTKQQNTEQLTEQLRTTLANDLNWRYEDRLDVMLSEFAQNRGAPVFELLASELSDKWDHKSIKLAPPELLAELGTLAKLSKLQIVFTCPAQQDKPALAAFWWPWDHGGTYSLRIKVLKNSYDIANIQQGFLAKVKGWFS